MIKGKDLLLSEGKDLFTARGKATSICTIRDS
jgi:hypothetical protein